MTIKLKPLHDQVLVITGASSGIGLATARRAAERGARVLLSARSEDELRQVVQDITAAGGTADYKAADVGDLAAMKAVAAHAVQRFGRIDSWVNNAGVAIYAKLLDTPEDEHRQLFQTNYFGPVHGALAAIPELRKQGGALITVGSVASDIPSPVMGAYAASKHALKGFVHSLRMELRRDAPNISVTLIKPAGIDTPIGQHAANHQDGEAQIPPPVYDPDLVADAILDAATRPVRDLTVGGAGRFQVLFGTHFPSLFERIAPKHAESYVDQSKQQPRPSNLFDPARAGRERSGEHGSDSRSFSLYTAAARHPKTTVVGVGAVLGAATLLLFRGKREA